MYSFYKPSTERERAGWIGPTSTRPARDLAIPGAKDGLKFCNMLQNEGLIQKDWALWPKNDTLYDRLLQEWLDLGARQVKADMLKQYDAEHR